MREVMFMPGKGNPHVALRVPRSLHAAMIEYAKANNMTVSDLIRAAIEHFLAHTPSKSQ